MVQKLGQATVWKQHGGKQTAGAGGQNAGKQAWFKHSSEKLKKMALSRYAKMSPCRQMNRTNIETFFEISELSYQKNCLVNKKKT